jgi:hypothetical protein
MITQSPEIADLAAAFALAQGAMGHAPKDSVGLVGQQRTRYADLAAVIDASRGPLAANGLAVIQGVETDTSMVVTVHTRLLHKSGQFMESALSMRPAQATPQGIGSTITYARRYALQAMLGLAADDDDGSAGSNYTSMAETAAAIPKRHRAASAGYVAEQAAADLRALESVARVTAAEAASIVQEFAVCFADEADRKAAKLAFVAEFGRPEDLPVARQDDAYLWLAHRAAEVDALSAPFEEAQP